MYQFQEIVFSTVEDDNLDGGDADNDDVEPMANTISRDRVETATQTDPSPCTCTHNVPVMKCVGVATDNVEFAAIMQHDHPYYAGGKQSSSEQSTTFTDHNEDTVPADHSEPTEYGTPVEVHDVTDQSEGADYIPDSPSSSNSSDSDVDSDIEHSEEDLVKEDKFIVYQSKQLPFFATCQYPGCRKPTVERPSTFTCGFALGVTASCIDGYTFTWHSQPKVGNVFAGNLAIPAALFITGNSYSTFAETCECVSLAALSTRQCYNIQRCYVVPEVQKAWTTHNESVLAMLSGDNLTLSGDARCDSPGHCVTFGTYTLLDSDSHLIVVQQTVHVTEVKNSYWLEISGLERCLDATNDHNVTTKVLATDRHPGIQKMLRETEQYEDIKHEYDLWHIQKGVKKKLSKSKLSELLVWIPAIINHLWYCVATCDGDPLLLKEKWISIMHHITNRHIWHTGEKFHCCEHQPYSREQAKSRPWLKKSSQAFQTLQKVVLNKLLLRDLEKVCDNTNFIGIL